MPDPKLQLTDNHRNTLLAGFKYIDHLLADSLAGLTATGDDGAVFSPLVPDATPVQRKVITDLAARLRRALRAALEACAVPVPPPTVGALWSLRTHLIAIEIALEDSGPDHLRGYGRIDDATAAGVAALIAQIRAALVELQIYLESGSGGDLSARLARLDQTRDEVRLLRELGRIVTAHGLVELRQPLSLLLDRLEKNWWVVAFVGRVSCGKSSLLNHLLATDVLPSGVTPVTAVPIRIVPGTEAVAVVAFARGKPERIAAAQLGEFASEEKNPGNVRHVTDILLELPAPRLADEICFVDTPGLGSLATAGAAQTLAFLPRCDLGVFMVDASASLTEEDLAVLRTLLESGAEVLVVLSKADMLASADREKMLAYIRKHLLSALGREVPTAPVSVASGHTALTETWFAAQMAPRQARHRELAAAALRRKVGALHEAAVVALSRRAGLSPGVPSSDGAQANFGAARAEIENCRRQLYDLAFRATPPVEAVLATVADTLAAAPRRITANGDHHAPIALELTRTVVPLGAEFEERLDGVRAMLARTLNAAGTSPETIALPEPFSRPLFDPTSVLAAGRLSSAWQRWPVAAVRRAVLRRHLSAQFAASLDEALRVHAQALVGWGQRYLDDLSTYFNAQAGFAEARSANAIPAPPSPELTHDLELLRHWDLPPAAP